MRDILITESAVGSHHRTLPFKARIVSLQGSRGVNVNPAKKAYEVSKNLVQGIKDLNPRYVFIGTDLDVQGTKVGTLIRNALNGGHKIYRYALTEKGYMRLGEFMSEERLQHLLNRELENIETSKHFHAKYGKKIGKKTAIVIGAVAHAKASGKKSVKVLSRGTSTVTAITKGLMKGHSASSVMQRLKNLYHAGSIQYPRVDNDYIQEKPYDLYPHPPLTSTGYRDEFVSPMEEEEVELNKKTILLELSNQRIITPAMATRYYNVIDTYFEDDLSPRQEHAKLVEECADIYEREHERYIRELEGEYYPQLKMTAPLPPPPAPTGSSRKKEEEEWEEMVKTELERLRREEEKKLAGERRKPPLPPPERRQEHHIKKPVR